MSPEARRQMWLFYGALRTQDELTPSNVALKECAVIGAANELKAAQLVREEANAWWLTENGQRWVACLSDTKARRDELARLCFDYFVGAYNQSRGNVWSIPYNDHTAHGFGIDPMEWRRTFRQLKTWGLIKEHTRDNWILTEHGEEACVDLTILEDKFQRRPSPQPSTSIHIGSVNAPSNIAGQGNSINITYNDVLNELIQKIQSSDEVPDAQKSYWTDALKQIASNSVAQGVAVKMGQGG